MELQEIKGIGIKTIELLNNSKFVTLLERLYNSKGFREAVQFDKKRLLKKCGLEK